MQIIKLLNDPRPDISRFEENPDIIDITPSWSSIMPGIIAAVQDGSRIAEEELHRLARIVDQVIAERKGE